MVNCVLVNAVRVFMNMKVAFKKAILSQFDPYFKEIYEGETEADLPDLFMNPKNMLSAFQMLRIL